MKKNITIKEFITAIKFNIGDGFEYQWDCYGKNAYSIGWMKTDRTATASIIYDIDDQKVYQMEVWDELNNKVYRWMRPECEKARKKEAQKRGVNDSIALDSVKYKEVSTSKIMSLLKAIYSRRNKKLGCLHGGR
jgi:hypothetical protein